MEDASYTQTLRDLDEQRGVFDIDDPLCARLGDVECKPEDVYVGFANMYKTGGYEKVHKAIQLNLPIRCAFNSRLSLLTTAILSP
jgi:hypothetical protein